MWCIPDNLDEEYIERMEDVLDIYEKQHNSMEPVICLDEKPVQLLSDARTPITSRPGRVFRRDSEYVRRGTANVFCAVEPLAGRHITAVTKNRKGPEYAKFLARISRRYHSAKTIHLVQDNLNTHKLKSLTDYYGMEIGKQIWSRFTVHYTPKHASWLNQAEIEISIYSNQCLGRRRLDSIQTLRSETNAWSAEANKKKLKICWSFTSKKAQQKFKYKKNKSGVRFTQ